MGSIQGCVITHAAVSAKQAKVNALHGLVNENRISRSGFWGSKGISCGRLVDVANRRMRVHDVKEVRCSFSSSSDGNGSMAENFNHNDADYVNCSVTEAVEVKSSPTGFMVKMRDGRHLRCAQNNPQAEQLPEYGFHPAIVLKIEDGTDLLFPIIVLETPSSLLMAAINNVQIARPTMYEVVMEMVDQMGYAVKLVRITEKVNEAYCAQLYITKLDGRRSLTFDLRPSDAINIAVRCKVPIQVNRNLAYNDGMKIIESAKLLLPGSYTEGFLLTELDWPTGEQCSEAKEFHLLLNMWTAAIEERYEDAAQWRDKLRQFRSKMNGD